MKAVFKSMCLPFILYLIFIALYSGCNTNPVNNNSNIDKESSFFVDSDWLLQNIEKENLLIIDSRGAPDDSSAYMNGHIPGAVWAVWHKFAKTEGINTFTEGYGTLLEPSQLSIKLSETGIDTNKIIVVYTDNLNGWGEDGRMVWMLRMANISKSYILNGSINFWKENNYPISTKYENPIPSTYTISSFNQDYNVSTEYLKSNLENAIIVDTRTEAEYRGDTANYGFGGHGGWGEKNFGHIPKAIHLPLANVIYKNGTLKTRDELTGLFSSYGITNKNSIIISYCTGGIRSALLTLVLREIGFSRAKNYDSSIWGWTAADLPVELFF